MSRYVQRCEQCQTVRGITSFRVMVGGGRSTVCRWCLGHATTRLKLARERTKVRAKRDALRAQLTEIERRLKVLAFELDPRASEAA